MAQAVPFVALLVAFLHCSNGQMCPKIEGVPGCACRTSEGTVDLTSIASEDGMT